MTRNKKVPNSLKCPVKVILKVANPQMSIPEKNVAAYISRCLLIMYAIDICEACLGTFQQEFLLKSTELSRKHPHNGIFHFCRKS